MSGQETERVYSYNSGAHTGAYYIPSGEFNYGPSQLINEASHLL